MSGDLRFIPVSLEAGTPAAGPSDRSELLLSLAGSTNRRGSFEAAFKEERRDCNSRGRR